MTDETQEPTAQELQEETQAGTDHLKSIGESIPADVTERGSPAILSYVRARIAAIENAAAAAETAERGGDEEGEDQGPTEPTLQKLADELQAGTERLQSLGEPIPPAVTVRGAVAILAYVRDRLAALEAEQVEREREAQDDAAEDDVIDAVVEVEAESEAGGVEEIGVIKGRQVGATPEPAGDESAQAVRAESLADALHGLATIRGILSSIEQYILWAGETIEDLHDRTARLGSTIEHVPDRGEIAAASSAAAVTEGAEPDE